MSLSSVSTHLFAVVPEDKCWSLWAVGYDASEIDDTALVHVDVRAALDPDMGNCKKREWLRH